MDNRQRINDLTEAYTKNPTNYKQNAMESLQLLKKLIYDGAPQNDIDLAVELCELYIPLRDKEEQKVEKQKGSGERAKGSTEKGEEPGQKVECYTVEALVKKIQNEK